MPEMWSITRLDVLQLKAEMNVISIHGSDGSQFLEKCESCWRKIFWSAVSDRHHASDVNKDWTQTHKDQDKDKDQSHKDKDKELTYKDSKQKKKTSTTLVF